MSFCSFSLGNLIHFNGFNCQLQNTPQNQSATLFSFELQPQPSKCQFDICTWIFCCYFKLSMLKTNLSFCPPPNQLTDFHISIGCTLSQIQSLMLISIFLSFSFKDMFSFLNFSSLTSEFPCLSLFCMEVAHIFSFLSFKVQTLGEYSLLSASPHVAIFTYSLCTSLL